MAKEMKVIGLDIGGTKSAVLLAAAGKDRVEFLGRKELPTTADWISILERLCEAAAVMCKENGVDPDCCVGGISCGGPLSADRQRICSPPNLPGWDQVPVIEYLKKRLSIPFFMENDADACALAEWKYGAGRGCDSMIFLTFGTGLGSGLILDGRLYRGASGMAGEAGHIRMETDGPVGYGKKGSLEGFCSGGGISRLAALYLEERRGKEPLPAFARRWGSDHITAKDLAEAAAEGDPDAKEIFSISGREFGRGLSILIDLLNPERIIAGSIYARCHDLLDGPMYEAIRQETLEGARKACTIHPAMLGERIGDYGAVMAAVYGMVRDSDTIPNNKSTDRMEA